MKKIEFRLDFHRMGGTLQFVVIIGLIAALLAGCSPTPTSAPAPVTTENAPAPTLPKSEPVKLVMWWWGEQEAPGAEKWMNETITLTIEKVKTLSGKPRTGK